jgi:FdhD protein
VIAVEGAARLERTDALAIEEPLTIRITHGPARDRRRTTLSVTMRTPGHDRELAAGFLLAEGVISEPDQMLVIEPGAAGSAVRVDLHPDVVVDLSGLERRSYTTSACGMCGKTSADAVEAACDGPHSGGPPVLATIIHGLPGRLREAQPTFAQTGGLHAAALFDREGKLHVTREDVGRHNAVDKVIGAEFLAGRLPLRDSILFVSGRAGFELVQKAAVAGVPVFAAVGAPSSLAVDLARRLGVTLLGFVRDGRFNIYAGPERIGV